MIHARLTSITGALSLIEGGVLGEVLVSHQIEGDMVEIGVADQGSGIPSAFRDQIFQKFSQADSSTMRSKGGTGLGLVICKELVQRMGGEIGFDSQEGRGTRFWVRLPLQ